MAERNARVFEWLVMILVIGLIVLLAVGVYTRMAADVQHLSFRLAAQNFETAVSGVRAQWYVQQSRGSIDHSVTVYGHLPGASAQGQEVSPVRVYLSRDGWPINTDSVAKARDGALEAWECMELWKGLLYQAPLAQLEGQEPVEGAAYNVSTENVGSDQVCRYRHLVDGSDRQYFDYLPRSGHISVNSSPE